MVQEGFRDSVLFRLNYAFLPAGLHNPKPKFPTRSRTSSACNEVQSRCASFISKALAKGSHMLITKTSSALQLCPLPAVINSIGRCSYKIFADILSYVRNLLVLRGGGRKTMSSAVMVAVWPSACSLGLKVAGIRKSRVLAFPSTAPYSRTYSRFRVAAEKLACVDVNTLLCCSAPRSIYNTHLKQARC